MNICQMVWNGKAQKYIGCFKSLDSAAKAAKAAYLVEGYHPNHGEHL